MPVPWLKICGITSLQDARRAEDAGADAIGLRLLPGDPRSLRVDDAAEIARGTTLQVVAVLSMSDPDALRPILLSLEPAYLQFEDRRPSDLTALPVPCIPTIRFEGRESLPALRGAPDGRFLVRLPADRLPGGDLHRAEPGLLKEVGRAGACVLGGAIHAGNLVAALRIARPWGLDLCEQVEREPGVLDMASLRRLCGLARSVT